MPTYKLGPASGEGKQTPVFRRPVVCEKCAEALGNVTSPAEFWGLSAALLVAFWPELRAAVERHEWAHQLLTPA